MSDREEQGLKVRTDENEATKSTLLWNEWIEVFAQSIIVVVIVLTFIFRVVNVKGVSMLNTLHDKDRVSVLKWNYKPKNGDVVVITKGEATNDPLIKRVIATEGQSFGIDFSQGKVFVDDKELNEFYLPERMWRQGNNDIPAVIPEGYTFVMGDNRNNSMDSRDTAVGLIPNKNIIGKATHVLFPVGRFGVIH